jgi:CRP-like cAMP-binding protein
MSQNKDLSKANHPPPGDDSDSKSSQARANAILKSLPDSDLEKILPKLKIIDLNLGDALYRAEEKIDYLYFPIKGIISLLAEFSDGSSVEAGVIGTEGFLGTPVALGAQITPHQAIVQITGQAMRLAAADLKTIVQSDGFLMKGMLLYTNVMFTQVAQTAACNRVHTLEQRLARWLLLTHDRVEGDEFELTQDFLSRMLGVRRAGVSVAANEFRQWRLIEYKRGVVHVLDREGLEQRACECYEIVKQEYDRYLKT